MFLGVPKEPGDGHEWTVSKDWDTNTGLTHDLFQVESVTTEYEALRACFKAEPMFLSIIDTILELDQGKNVWDKRKARHRAAEFMIGKGKLW